MPTNSNAARAVQSAHTASAASTAIVPAAQNEDPHSRAAASLTDAPSPDVPPTALKSPRPKPRKKPSSRKARAARRRQSDFRKLRAFLKHLRARVRMPDAMRLIGLDEVATARKMKTFAGRLSRSEEVRDSGKLLLELLRDCVKCLEGPPASTIARATSTMSPTANVPIQMIYQVPRPDREAAHIAPIAPPGPSATIAPPIPDPM